MDKNKENKVKVVIKMALLSDELLTESYHQAVQLNLDEDFIAMLLVEMKRRRLRSTDTNQRHMA
ncbi:sporulation histidine kinase inhibitor Sda [Paenibacillus marinisediminis]